ncbi:Spo0B domain-containing protein [Vibrio sp. M60_M31a]
MNGKNLVVNRVTLRTSGGEPYGAVFSLRDQNEMHVLSEKISQVNQYMENMRVTRHEYQNKLSTISGLLQMGAYEKALSVCFVSSESQSVTVGFIACPS